MLILTQHENMFLNQIIISVTQQASKCQRLTVSLSLVHLQILQGNAWGHSGIRRHECRVLRQRQTMATWNQPKLWRRVPNIRWVCTFHCSDRVRGLSSPRHPWSKNRLYPWIERTPVLWENCSKLRFPSRSCWVTFRNVHFSVGNKNDDPNSKVVETTDAQKFAEQMGINLFETSAKENINVEEVTRRFCCVWPQTVFAGWCVCVGMFLGHACYVEQISWGSESGSASECFVKPSDVAACSTGIFFVQTKP